MKSSQAIGEINAKGKALNILGKWFGSLKLQGVYEKFELILFAVMNVGGATLAYETNGEMEVMRLIKSHYSDDEKIVIFDVGAHNGSYARRLCDVFGNSATIHCFEPSSSLFSSLKQNLRNADCILHSLAMGDVESEIILYSADDNIPTLLSNAFDVTGQQLVSQETIKCSRMDYFCDVNKIVKVHFLKVDVEGFELNVLKGAGDLLQSSVDFIQFEFGQHCVASRTFMHDFYKLLQPNFRIYRVVRSGITELGPYSSRLERFSSATNYLAVSTRMNL